MGTMAASHRRSYRLLPLRINLIIRSRRTIALNFVHAWQDDLEEWQTFSSGVNDVGNTRDAMDFLAAEYLESRRIWCARGRRLTELRSPVGSTDSQSEPPLALPKGSQKLSLAGRFEAEGLVGMLSIVIVLQHPQHHLGHPYSTIDLGQVCAARRVTLRVGDE